MDEQKQIIIVMVQGPTDEEIWHEGNWLLILTEYEGNDPF